LLISIALLQGISGVCLGSLRMVCACRPEEGKAIQYFFLEFFEVQVNRRGDEERHKLRNNQPANDHQAKRATRRSVGPVAKSNGKRSQQRRHRGHHDRTEAFHAGVVNSACGKESKTTRRFTTPAWNASVRS